MLMFPSGVRYSEFEADGMMAYNLLFIFHYSYMELGNITTIPCLISERRIYEKQ